MVRRLAFEALRLLASLFCHKKFTLEWISRGGLTLLMQVKIQTKRFTSESRMAFLYLYQFGKDALKILLSKRNLLYRLSFVQQVVNLSSLLHRQLPRPSLAATGSSLCLYYLACDDDTMEKICCLPANTLRDLVR